MKHRLIAIASVIAVVAGALLLPRSTSRPQAPMPPVDVAPDREALAAESGERVTSVEAVLLAEPAPGPAPARETASRVVAFATDKVHAARTAWTGAFTSGAARFDSASAKVWSDALPAELQPEVVWLHSRAFLAAPVVPAGGDGYVQLTPAADPVVIFAHPGLTVWRHVTNRTWHVSGDAERFAALAADPRVVGFATPLPEDRIAPGIAAGAYVAPAGDAIRARVLFDCVTRPVAWAEASAAVAAAADSIDSDPAAYGAWIDITIRPARIAAMIAAAPAIAFVDDSSFATPTTSNAAAAALSNVDQVQAMGFDGSTETLAVIDAGAPLTTHQELTGRTLQGDGGAYAAHFHSTHVAGTMMASGVQPAAKGMAPACPLLVFYDWNNYIADLANAGTRQAAAVNNSWGWAVGWSFNGATWTWANNTQLFGAYTADSQAIDQQARNAGSLQICWAAGNDRSDISSGHPHDGTPVDLTPWWVGGPPPANPFSDCVGTHGIAKNVLCVGAITGGETTTTFSSWGPADDGRIKPDLCAKGQALYSCYTPNNNSYASISGTSMATPVVTGSMALLSQAWKAGHAGAAPPSEVLRAAVVQTAKDLYALNGYAGPDLITGHGKLDAKAAADLIVASADHVATGSVANAATTEIVVAVEPGTAELAATLAWTDPAGNPAATMALTNDLDLVIADPVNGEQNLVWMLDRFAPGAPATKGRNAADTIEKAALIAPTPGNYALRIRGTAIPQGPQAFAVASGLPIVDHWLRLDAPPTNGATTTIRVHGPPNAAFTICWARTLKPTPIQFPGYSGDFWLKERYVWATGTLDASGNGSAPLTLAANPALVGRPMYWQALVAGQWVTTRTDTVIQ